MREILYRGKSLEQHDLLIEQKVINKIIDDLLDTIDNGLKLSKFIDGYLFVSENELKQKLNKMRGIE